MAYDNVSSMVVDEQLRKDQSAQTSPTTGNSLPPIKATDTLDASVSHIPTLLSPENKKTASNASWEKDGTYGLHRIALQSATSLSADTGTAKSSPKGNEVPTAHPDTNGETIPNAEAQRSSLQHVPHEAHHPGTAACHGAIATTPMSNGKTRVTRSSFYETDERYRQISRRRNVRFVTSARHPSSAHTSTHPHAGRPVPSLRPKYKFKMGPPSVPKPNTSQDDPVSQSPTPLSPALQSAPGADSNDTA